MKRTKVLGVAVAVAALGATATWGLRRAPSAGPSSVATPVMSASSRPIAARPSRAMPGDVARYELTLDTDAAVADGAGLRAPMHARTTGELVERAIQVTPTGAVSVLTVDAAEGPREILGRGIVVERDARGAVTRARLPLGAGANDAGALLSLAAHLSMSAPAAAEAQWDAREATAHGTRAAHYERGEGGAFVKRVLGITAPTRGRSAIANETGELRGALDDRGVLVSLTGVVHEEHRVASAIIARMTTTLTIVRTSTERDLARAVALSASLDDAYGPWQSLDAPLPRSKEDDTRALANIAGARTAGDVDALIARANAKDAAARKEIGEVLWAYLRLHPEATAAIGARVAKMKPNDGAAKLLANALVSTATPEAQRALVEIARAWKGDEAARAIIAGLGIAPSPTRDTEEFLRATLEENGDPNAAHASAVALGNVADHVRKDDPARADAIAADLLERAKSATGPTDQSAALAALGNARAGGAAEIAGPLLRSADAQVRRMAAFALGRSGDPAARALLEECIKRDPDETVRREAADALGT